MRHFPALVDVTGLGATLVATRVSRLRHPHQLPNRLRSRLRCRCHRRARQTPSRPRRRHHRHQRRCHRQTPSRRRLPLLGRRFRTPSPRRFPPRNLRQRARGPEARLPASRTAARAPSWATPSAGNPPLFGRVLRLPAEQDECPNRTPGVVRDLPSGRLTLGRRCKDSRHHGGHQRLLPPPLEEPREILAAL